MTGGASFGRPAGPGQVVSLTPPPGATVDNTGLNTSALLLLIQACNTNTQALAAVLARLSGGS